MTIKKLLKSLIKVKPIKILNYHFNEIENALYIHVSLTKGQRHRCPICHKRCPGYDTITIQRRWRTLDFGTILVYIVADVERIECKEHGVLSEAVPWAYHNSRFTKVFEAHAIFFATRLTKTDVADTLRIDWRTVGEIIKRCKDRIDPDHTLRYDGLVRIGIDETSYKKGHKYLTVIVDHDTSEVVWCHKGHGKEVLRLFFEELTKDQRASIKLVSADGARWIAEVCDEYLEDYDRCIDRYHVTSWCIEALDELRKEIWRDIKSKEKEAPKRDRGRPLKGVEVTRSSDNQKPFKYSLGKNPDHLTENQKATLLLIEKKHPRLYRAYLIKESLRAVFDSEDPESSLKAWLNWASHSKLRPIVELSKKIRKHKEAILATCHHRLSNARIEAINNKIKVIIRKAYGFRNIDNLLAMIMITCSDLYKQIMPAYRLDPYAL